MIGSVYEKELLLGILKVSYYPEPDSHTRDKVKIILELSNYATKRTPDAPTLNQANQYKTDKQSLEKKLERLI